MHRTSAPVVEVGAGVHVVVRGWLHGNTVLLPADSGAIIDTGYHTGVAELVDHVELHSGRPVAKLERILLTHVHSDHAGGCAELTRRSNAQVWGHADCRSLVEAWDRRRLWLEGNGQELPGFAIDHELRPGDTIATGPLRWRVVYTPGHAVGGVAFYEPDEGLLIAGDALWEDGFGGLAPRVEGEEVFDLAAQALDALAGLDVKTVIPGHGAPFRDHQAAIERARARLERYRTDRVYMAWHNFLGLIGFWALGHPEATEGELRAMIAELPCHDAGATHEQLVQQACASGVVTLDSGRAHPGPRVIW